MFGRNGVGSKWRDQATQTKDAFRSYFELIDPKASVDSAKELSEITEAIARARGMEQRGRVANFDMDASQRQDGNG